jgi:hypothetical protein
MLCVCEIVCVWLGVGESVPGEADCDALTD